MIRLSVMAAVLVMAVGCGAGEVRESTARVGVAGGALTAGKTTLVIPAGALKGETEVRLRETETLRGRHIEMEPRGVALAMAGQVEVEVEHGVELERVRATEPGDDQGGLRRRDDAQRGVIELEVEHLTEVEIENPADDKGGAVEPGDDKGGATEPGDDQGGGK